MSSNAMSGQGTVFKVDDTVLAEVNSISGPSMTRESIDVTSLNTTGGYREKIPGFRDGGQVTLEMNYTKDTYEQMNNLFESNDSTSMEIELPCGSTLAFDGYVMETPLEISVGEKITANVTIEVSGEPTFTKATT